MIGTKESWSDKNSLRNYPLVVASGNFPSGIIIDAFVSIWCVHVAKPCVTALSIGPSLVSIVFSDEDTGADLFAAIGEAGVDSVVDIIPAVGIEASGYIKFGSSTIQNGHTQYAIGDIKLLNHCFVNIGLSTVTSATTQGLGKEIQGDLSITLSGDFSVTPKTVDSPIVGDETVLEISLNNAERYIELCSLPSTVCECPKKPIKQINSVLPNSVNNGITIESPLDIIEISSNEFGITISALAPSNQICPPNKLPQVGGKLQGEK